MSTRNTHARVSRGRWEADDDFAADFDLDNPDSLEDLDELGDLDEPARSGKPRHAPKAPAKVGGKRRKTRAADADLDDAFSEDDDIDPEISDLLERKERDRRKATISESFKCRNCRSFIGMPPTGGSQRNHCPMCLYSLHVDLKTPGDRASDCRSLMEPVGSFYRLNLEQVVVHRCLGCGFERYNRIAADDNPILLASLPIVDLPKQANWDGE